jgi:cyclase
VIPILLARRPTADEATVFIRPLDDLDVTRGRHGELARQRCPPPAHVIITSMRWTVLGLLLGCGIFSITLSALQQPAAAPPQAAGITTEKLRDNLYMMRGGGGNSAVFITARGVVVVDTKIPGWGQPLIDSIRKVTDKPVTTIINTHTHYDHASGNVEFPTTVEVVTQINTRQHMRLMLNPTGVSPDSPANIFKDNDWRGMPTRTFARRMTLGSGNDRVNLYYFGRGHTDGDAFVVFPALGYMHAGDIFSGKNIPLLDAINGGSGVEIGKTLRRAGHIKGVTSIITGHSTVMTPKDLLEYADFNDDFAVAVRAAKKAGKTVDEVAKTWTIPTKYAGYAAPAAARLRNNIQIVFDEAD